jgi:hypothetical protein
MTIAKVTRDKIVKTVRTSNSIEGYKSASLTVKTKSKLMMEKYNVKVSAKR